MSIPLVVNNVTYNYPTDNDLDWGYQASEWAAAITENLTSGGGSGGAPGIDSIAALRELVHTSQTRVSVNSYYGDNNGGGGIFYYVEPVEGVSHTDDGGITIIANDTSVWKRANVDTINIKWFGAKGNGTGDDTPFIQRALDAAGARALTFGTANVYVPTGQYPIYPNIDNWLWLYARPNRQNYAGLFIDSGVTIQGDGWASEFKLMSTPDSPGTTDGRGDYATSHILVNRGAVGLPPTIQDHDINVLDMGFDGGWINESGECVTMAAVDRFKISGCHFKHTFFECSYMVYSRNGIWTDNVATLCGLPPSEPLNDGGGPMIDTCSHIIISNNVFTDIGYYAVLAIDSYDCAVENNIVKEDTYPSSAGYQAIRVQGCARLTVADNKIWKAGYNGIWMNNSNDCIVKHNVAIQCGFGSGGGNQISGIQVEADAGVRNGGHLIEGNFTALNKGSGISTVDAATQNDLTDYHSGHTISNNKCVYNNRDGIAVYGNYHRIINNTCISNGTSIDDGIVGNGYSGISLAGSNYCLVSGNTCRDIILEEPVPMNLDAWISPNNTFSPVYIEHPSRTQNYGIYEGIGFQGELQVDCNVTKSLTTLDDGLYYYWDTTTNGPVPAEFYSGYVRYVATAYLEGYWIDLYDNIIPSLGAWEYELLLGNPRGFKQLPLATMGIYTITGTPHGLVEGDTFLLSDRRGLEGESLSGLYTVGSVTGPAGISVSLNGYYPQFDSGERTGEIWISQTIAEADFNIISANNVMNNLVNPLNTDLGGIGTFSNDLLVSGANSTRVNNLGN